MIILRRDRFFAFSLIFIKIRLDKLDNHFNLNRLHSEFAKKRLLFVASSATLIIKKFFL